MAFETEYLGFKIHFAENEEVWRCWALSIENKSLSKCKAAVSKSLRDELKLAHLVCGRRAWGSVSKAQITGLVDGKSDKVWITTGTDKDSRRSQEDMKSLFPWTPENESLLAEAEAIRKQANSLLKQADEKLKEIKPFSLDELAAIISQIKKQVSDASS